jgi:hypothetical protein
MIVSVYPPNAVKNLAQGLSQTIDDSLCAKCEKKGGVKMRPTKSFKKLLSDPSVDSETLLEYKEYECEICGVTLVDRLARFACFQPHPKHEGDGDLGQNSCDVCLDCREAGVASFPDRLRKRAQQLEQRARELQQLANAEFLPLGEYSIVYSATQY